MLQARLILVEAPFLAASALLGANIWRGLQTRSWKATDGHIVTSERTVSLPGRPGRLPLARIQYRYRVGEREYLGKTLGYQDRMDTVGEDATELVKMHKSGRRVRVWYDPVRPERAVLYRGVGTNLWMFFIATVLGAVGLAVFALWSRGAA